MGLAWKGLKTLEDILSLMSANTITIESPSRLTRDEYEGLLETLDIMRDPETMKQLKRSDENFKKGKFITLGELEKELGLANRK